MCKDRQTNLINFLNKPCVLLLGDIPHQCQAHIDTWRPGPTCHTCCYTTQILVILRSKNHHSWHVHMNYTPRHCWVIHINIPYISLILYQQSIHITTIPHTCKNPTHRTIYSAAASVARMSSGSASSHLGTLDSTSANASTVTSDSGFEDVAEHIRQDIAIKTKDIMLCWIGASGLLFWRKMVNVDLT